MAPRARSRALLSFLLSSLSQPTIHALSLQSAPSPNLDLTDLGRVVLAGSFDAISLYDYVGQSQSSFNANGSQSLLAQYQNGDFADLLSSDASINAMCPFTTPNGTLMGIIVAGNFTALAGQEAQAVAMYDPDSQSVTPLAGLTGQVSSLYCDNDHETVYFGGSFTGADSSNAIAWTTGWTNLPFAGFNGPVNSIARLPNGNIVFGGAFTGLASTPSPRSPDAQIVNLVSANITSAPNATDPAYANPANIVCQAPSQAGAANGSWLLADGQTGYWQADFGFGFVPTKLRMYQTQLPNRGVKTWRFTALPLNGLLNFTYTDESGVLQSCTSTCPLPQGNTTAQDFHFVNYVGMNSFRIDVSDYYGQGAGLGGIELFEDDIFTYAINAYNEPVCDDVSRVGSNSSLGGDWNQTALGAGAAQYLSTFLPNGTNATDADLPYVTFYPDIEQPGNYSIVVFTPGCQADNTCSTRGQVNITGNLAASGNSMLEVQLYQSNDNEKYDTFFNVYVDAVTEGFRPSLTLTPSLGQAKNLTVVAERIQFVLTASTGGLNGLYEYNPSQVAASTNFNQSAIDMAGAALNRDSEVNRLAVIDSDLYVAGQFSNGPANNILVVRSGDGDAMSLANGGLNAAVLAMYQNASLLYLGGNFTSTHDNQMAGLSNVALYDSSVGRWSPLGAGVNGQVTEIVPITVELPSNQMTPAVSISGYFDFINAFGSNPAISVSNLAVWVPSQQNWLQNLGSQIALSGRINAQTDVPGGSPIYAGNVQSQSLSASGVTELESSGDLSLASLPINITALSASSAGTVSKRAGTTPSNVDGVVTGLFYRDNGLNLTILGGHFSATATNGSTVNNLAFIDGLQSNRVTGITGGSASASILALEVHGTTLFAGGTVDGGLVLFDLTNTATPSTPPPALSGAGAAVHAIASRPDSTMVYVGGSFANAGALTCTSLCVYDVQMRQWSAVPASTGGLASSSVINVLAWASPNRLLLAGNFTVGSNASTVASYDPSLQQFHALPGSADPANVPGPVTAFTPADQQYGAFFVAGAASSDSSAFIAHWAPGAGSSDANPLGSWTVVGGGGGASLFGAGSVIDSLQVMSLSRSHASTPLLADDQTLLVMGSLVLPGFGNASAALFDGATLEPFALATMADGSPGAVRRAFVENPQNLLVRREHHLALGLVVLIGLAISLALVFLLVVGGVVAERVRRRREGYVPAPTRYSPPSWAAEKGGFGGLGGGGGGGGGSNTAVGGIRAEELFGQLGPEGGSNGGGGGDGGNHSPPRI